MVGEHYMPFAYYYSKMFLAARRIHNRNNNHNYKPILRKAVECMLSSYSYDDGVV